MRRFFLIFVFTLTLVVFIGVGFLYIRERIISDTSSGGYDNEADRAEPAGAESGFGGRSVVSEKSVGEDIVLDEFIKEEETAAPDVSGADDEQWADGGVDTEPAPEPEQTDPYSDIAEDSYTRKVRTASPDTARVAFAGDILFDKGYAIQAQMEQRGGGIEGAIGASLLERMRGADILVVNNEFPYTDRGAPQEGKTFTFHAAVKTVRQLKDMGVDLAGLANNHTFDYGEQGFLDTLDTLDRAGMARMGAGRDIDEASHPFYFVAGGMKLAFIAATQIERLDNPNTRGATDSLPGVFRCMDEKLLLERVREASRESDFVTVFIHWGTENETEPDWLQNRQAPELAEAGADLIIGAHSHCLQPVGFEGDTPVFYSLGNFLFNSKTLDTCLVECEIERTESGAALKTLKFVPCVQSGCRVYEASPEDRSRILQFMRDISSGVGIDDEGNISLISATR